MQNKIYTIRDEQVMVDRDLALLYGVETRMLNEQVKRFLQNNASLFTRIDSIEK